MTHARTEKCIIRGTVVYGYGYVEKHRHMDDDVNWLNLK